MRANIIWLLAFAIALPAGAATEWRAEAHAKTGLPFKVLREIPDLDHPQLMREVEALEQSLADEPTDASNVIARVDLVTRYHDALQNDGVLLNYRIATELNAAMRANGLGQLEDDEDLANRLDDSFRELRKAHQMRGKTGKMVLRSPSKPELNAKTHATVRIDYVVDTPLEQGARIRMGQNWYGDLGRIQFSRPLDENYATISSNRDGVEFVTGSRIWLGQSFTGLSGGNRPMVTLKRGRLEPGDVVSFTFGDTSEGSPGWLIQSFTNDAMDLRFETDFNGDAVFVPIAQPRFHVYGKDASHIRVVAPSVIRPGEAFTVRASVEDMYFNRAANGLPRQLELWHEGERIARTRAIQGDPAVFHFEDVTITSDEAEPDWFEVKAAQGELSGNSNPVVTRTEAPYLYWGETHGHEGYTDANGSPEWYMNFAKNVAFLDYASLTGHDIMLSEVHFRHNYLVADSFNVPQDGFVTFRAWEWTQNWRTGGHHNVFLLDDRQKTVTVMQAPELRDMIAMHNRENDADKVLLIPHAHQPGDWNIFGADLVEIFSQHGSFEWFGRKYLQKGHKVGINVASDDHIGHPGNAPSRGRSRGGLAAVFAPELSREAIFGNLKARHTYGTSFARIYVETDVDGAKMGDTTEVSGDVMVDGFTAGTHEIADITLIVNGEETQQLVFDEPADTSRLRFRITVNSEPIGSPNAPRTPAGDQRYYGRVFIHKQGEEVGLTYGSQAKTRIAAATPLGIEPYGDRLVQSGTHEASFNLNVRGDYDGALLDLEDLDDNDYVTVQVVSSPLFEHWNTQALPRLPGEWFNVDVPQQSVVLKETVRIGDLKQQRWVKAFDERAEADLVLVGEEMPRHQSFSFDVTEEDGLRPGDDNYIYVRVRQLDDETAWSSPTFIDWRR